jgi:hypothetical protein
MSTFNISDFISQTNSVLARTAHFSFSCSLPTGVSGSAATLSLLCTSANLPTEAVTVGTVKRYGYGIDDPYALGVSYDDLLVNFYCDATATVISSLQDWINLVMPTKTGTGAMKTAYKDSYVSTITVVQYGADGSTIKTVTFHDAFITSFGPINYSWASRDDLVIIPATFNYTYYEVK